MNREMRRRLGMKKRLRHDWTCPNCKEFYTDIYEQSVSMPFLFCFRGCNRFFDYHNDNDVTIKMYPGGVPWEEKEQ